jgi:hypothetical protein
MKNLIERVEEKVFMKIKKHYPDFDDQRPFEIQLSAFPIGKQPEGLLVELFNPGADTFFLSFTIMIPQLVEGVSKELSAKIIKELDDIHTSEPKH